MSHVSQLHATLVTWTFFRTRAVPYNLHKIQGLKLSCSTGEAPEGLRNDQSSLHSWCTKMLPLSACVFRAASISPL